jgi:hypothetical protein
VCLQSLQYYGSWQEQQQQQQQQRSSSQGAKCLSGLNSSDLLSLSQDDGTAALQDPGPAAAAAAAAAGLPGASSSLQSSFALYNTGCRSGSYSSSSSHMQLMGASSNPISTAPVVPCSIYFPGNRRPSKTLALAVPGMSHMPFEGAATAYWLGPVMTVSAAAAAAAGCSALSEVVEAHRQLAQQQARLEVLQQLLDDKEMLLRDARQMVSGSSFACLLFLQLLVITHAHCASKSQES